MEGREAIVEWGGRLRYPSEKNDTLMSFLYESQWPVQEVLSVCLCVLVSMEGQRRATWGEWFRTLASAPRERNPIHVALKITAQNFVAISKLTNPLYPPSVSAALQWIWILCRESHGNTLLRGHDDRVKCCAIKLLNLAPFPWEEGRSSAGAVPGATIR